MSKILLYATFFSSLTKNMLITSPRLATGCLPVNFSAVSFYLSVAVKCVRPHIFRSLPKPYPALNYVESEGMSPRPYNFQ